MEGDVIHLQTSISSKISPTLVDEVKSHSYIVPYVEPQGSETGNDMHARDKGRFHTKESPIFFQEVSIKHPRVPVLPHSSTWQACYFEALSSAALHLGPSSVLNCSVLRKILLITLFGCLAAGVRSDPPSCNSGCGVAATDRTAPEPNRAAASDPASNGVLQSQGQLLGWGGESFLVLQ